MCFNACVNSECDHNQDGVPVVGIDLYSLPSGSLQSPAKLPTGGKTHRQSKHPSSQACIQSSAGG